MKFDQTNADMKQGFHGFTAAFEKLGDGRTRARTKVAGKSFEAFGQDMKDANNNLERRVREAVAAEEVVLNEL